VNEESVEGNSTKCTTWTHMASTTLVANIMKLTQFWYQICDIHLRKAVKAKTSIDLCFRPHAKVMEYCQFNKIDVPSVYETKKNFDLKTHVSE